jgi:hypothetical protein
MHTSPVIPEQQVPGSHPAAIAAQLTSHGCLFTHLAQAMLQRNPCMCCRCNTPPQARMHRWVHTGHGQQSTRTSAAPQQAKSCIPPAPMTIALPPLPSQSSPSVSMQGYSGVTCSLLRRSCFNPCQAHTCTYCAAALPHLLPSQPPHPAFTGTQPPLKGAPTQLRGAQTRAACCWAPQPHLHDPTCFGQSRPTELSSARCCAPPSWFAPTIVPKAPPAASQGRPPSFVVPMGLTSSRGLFLMKDAQ